MHLHLHMQQAALLETVVRDVFVLVPHHRPAGQQRIAMFTMLGDGIGAVDGFVALRGQKVGLGQLWPMVKVALFAPVQLAHLLQADQVSVQLLHGQAQVMDLQPARRAQALHTLVDVVRGDAQNIGVLHATDCVATRDNGLSRIRRRAPMGLH